MAKSPTLEQKVVPREEKARSRNLSQALSKRSGYASLLDLAAVPLARVYLGGYAPRVDRVLLRLLAASSTRR